MALFGKKGFRIEVVDGIDIESAITLSGERMTVGTGSGDSLRLGEADVVPAQVTFQRKAGQWEYFVSDRGATQVTRGHARAGRLRVGQEFRLGASARLAVRATAAPVEVVAEKGGPTEKKEIPIALALPVLGLVVLGVFVVMTQVRGGDAPPSPLATARWFTQSERLDPAIDACLAGAQGMAAAAVGRDAPDWAFQEWLRSASPAARATLVATVRDAISRAHFLHSDGRNAEASEIFRRLENAIPVGNRDCPILAATRRDLAVLQMMGRNRP